MAVRVQVPASTANLGPAFDCAAIALNLYLRVSAEPKPTAGFAVRYRGADSNRVASGDANLVVQAMIKLAASEKAVLPGARVEIENDIPIGVGLGSSAAAIIGGLLAGAGLCGLVLDRATLLRHAVVLEHHPDNVTAALHGGFVVAAAVSAGSRLSEEIIFHRNEISEELEFVAVTPDVPLPTEKARSVLPDKYSREDAVCNLQRTALLTAAFVAHRGLTPELFRDRLHQPYRSPLIPGISDCLEFRHEGLLGVFISGAGSSVMAIVTENAESIGEELVHIFSRRGVNARAIYLKADNHGAQVL
jgi:homoserine kinase